MSKPTLTFNGVSLSLVEYQGQRVVTFDMIDTVHQRKKGASQRSFTRHKKYFREGRDYFIASTVQNRQFVRFGICIPNRGLTLLTESGYLLLVKSFNDPLSWQIQSQLVEIYFRTVPEFPELHHVVVPDVNALAQMPLAEAQHAVTRAEGESFREHGQRSSQSMTLRRREKKTLVPVLALVQGWSQPPLTGFDAACGEDDA